MKKRDILHVNGELDVLPYYYKVSFYPGNFLSGKKIASKVHLPDFSFLKRGSKEKPLFIDYFKFVDEEMIKIRKGNHLKDVREKLNKKQELVWEYFPPRKLIDFFYATNGEGIGKEIERIFIDIDRRKHSADDSRIVALNLIDVIKNDRYFNKLVKIKKVIVLWTGASFHVYLLLKNKIDLRFYDRYLSYGEKKSESFIMKWASLIEKETGIPVRAGHEKSEKFIVLDSSNTPSGKLARSPFSLHIKNWKDWDGVCVPVSVNELADKGLVKRLQDLTAEKVLKNLDYYKKLI